MSDETAVGGWEIVDRWSTFPSGPSCSTNNAFNCDEPDLQWGGDPTKLTAAKNAYEDQLNAAIDLFRAKGAKVLVVNSPYYAPTEAQIPAVPVWYEPYSPTAPANWIAPNGDPAYTYRSSKTKIDQFNAAVQEVVAQRDPAFVQPFDLWALVSPNGQYDPSNREADRVHLTQAAFQNIILSNLLPVIQQMLS